MARFFAEWDDADSDTMASHMEHIAEKISDGFTSGPLPGGQWHASPDESQSTYLG